MLLLRRGAVRPVANDPDHWSPLQGLPRRVSGGARWLRGLGLGLLVGLLAGGLDVRHTFQSVEDASFAYRLAERAQSIAHAPIGPIAIVAIDDSTCQQLPAGCAPVPRADTAAIIDKLRTAGVRAIGLDQTFYLDRAGTPELAAAMHRAGNVVVVEEIDTSGTAGAAVTTLRTPIAPIAGAASAVGMANVTADPQHLVRFYSAGGSRDGIWYPSFALAMLRQFDSRAASRWREQTIQLNYAGPPGQTYPQYPYIELLNSPLCLDGHRRHVHCAGVQGRDLWDNLSGTMVLLGRSDQQGNTDFWANALGGSAPMPGVEVQATALNTLYFDDPIATLPGIGIVAITVAAAMLVAAAATLAGLLAGLLLGLLALAVYYGLSFLALSIGDIWLPVVSPEIAMVTSFLLVLGARYTLEAREQRRTRLLFSRFVPPAVVDDLMADIRGYGVGERRAIAVVFTDIRGFTTLSEHTAPEVVMGALRTYFSRMVTIVLAHGGTVDKYIGDGLMALFGAPLAMPEPCLAALRTAVAMQGAMREINAILEEPLGVELRIGVGIHYGDAVFGLSGAPSKLEFTAIGDTVNTASRLESLCRDQGFGIVISESVYLHLPPRLQQATRDLGEVSVKGRQSSIHVYGVMAPAPDLLQAAGGS